MYEVPHLLHLPVWLGMSGRDHAQKEGHAPERLMAAVGTEWNNLVSRVFQKNIETDKVKV